MESSVADNDYRKDKHQRNIVWDLDLDLEVRSLASKSGLSVTAWITKTVEDELKRSIPTIRVGKSPDWDAIIEAGKQAKRPTHDGTLEWADPGEDIA